MGDLMDNGMQRHETASADVYNPAHYVYLVFAGPSKPIFMDHRHMVWGYRNGRLSFITKEVQGLVWTKH